MNSLLNLTELSELCSGDSALQEEIIRELIHSVPDYLLGLRASLAERDAARIAEIACKLRGTTSVCAVIEVPTLCQALEKYAVNYDFLSAERFYKKIEKRLFKLVDFYTECTILVA
jgi:HPt (histidine-containing phosphotransfer) domain-containing protein